jgi:hypothetical protein
MHDEILSPEQSQYLPLLVEFSPQFVLIGGTAVALQLGHRRSIDFDLMTFSHLQSDSIKNTLKKYHPIDSILVDEPQELTVAVGTVKFTFLHYPFTIPANLNFKGIPMPDILSLAAMKAFTLGRRAKWKDYVDLYFIFQNHTVSEISEVAKRYFQGEFNEKIFREQLAYFSDIDYSEQIEYMKGYEIQDDAIKNRLIEFSLQKSNL